MATRPRPYVLTNTSVDVLNAIRNSASTNYRDYVPVATPNAESIREIGAIIMDYPALQNEFLSALVNRIGLVMITSKMYTNPWNMFKKGKLDFGETIEEIFVNIVKPHQYDPVEAEGKLFKRELPDVRSAFHVMNYQKFYPTTIQNDDLRQAFLSWDGITDLITKIVEAMYTSAEYDEFLTMKYMLAKLILEGRLTPVTVPAISNATIKQTVTAIKNVANKMTFMSGAYNMAGVSTHTPKEEQYIIMSSDFDSSMDVEVLASAFNMDKADFIGHRVLVDSFGEFDMARLDELFEGDETYKRFTQTELDALKQIPAVLLDQNFFMIYDKMYKFTENYNGMGLYWQYFYHVWKIFSASPFANNAVFIPAEPTVTSVTVSPKEATIPAGSALGLTASVVTENFAPQEVAWTTNNADVTVNGSGQVTVGEDVVTGTQITVTATSTYDPEKSDTATITVG